MESWDSKRNRATADPRISNDARTDRRNLPGYARDLDPQERSSKRLPQQAECTPSNEQLVAEDKCGRQSELWMLSLIERLAGKGLPSDSGH